MAYLPGLLDPLELGILDEIVGPEGAVQRDVDVAVYRGGDHQPAVPLVVTGKVGAAAADRDAQRGLGDDYAGTCCTCARPRRQVGARQPSCTLAWPHTPSRSA